MLVTAEVEGRVSLDRAAHVVDDDVAAFALLDVVVHKAHLQCRLQRQAIERQQQLALLQQGFILLQLGQQRLVVFQALLEGNGNDLMNLSLTLISMDELVDTGCGV